MKLAAYDPNTDVIEGCEPGTFEYWHEERHRWQNKMFPFEAVLAQVEVAWIVLALVFNAAWVLFPLAVYLVGIEIDAMWWALRKQWRWVK